MRIQKTCSFILFLFFSAVSFAQQSSYQYYIDLLKVENDRLNVVLTTPKVNKDKVSYFIPKIVPGTYSIYDFGRFVSDFKAMDSLGNILEVEHTTDNQWIISNAKSLHKISYWVEDTYDTQKGNFVFEPGGTNIEENDNYILNTHGFCGYFEGLKRIPYNITFRKPEGFYGSTSLVASKIGDKEDVFEVGNYMDLVDAPIMYNKPDTTVLQIGGADILVSVYSPNGVLKSSEVAKDVKEILEAQRKYLGGTLPIKKYAFLIYLTKYMVGGSGMHGALEHSYSSLYFLPELGASRLSPFIKDVAAHEFFHIVTPLNIHAEQIHDFDFIKPQMSEHLWLYEGVTEYSAHHVQVKYGIISQDKFIETIHQKILNGDKYKRDLPFTEMSAECLEKYKDQYGNVYEKGALIGMCIDIKLRALTEGKYGIQQMMQDLSKTYGKDKAFKDEKLFAEIEKVTGKKEIHNFLKKYVAGHDKLPLKEIFELVGYQYDADFEKEVFTLGNIHLKAGDNGSIFIGTEDMNQFGKMMKYQDQDQLEMVAGVKVSLNNIEDVMNNTLSNAKRGELLTVVVKRKNKKGKIKTKKLKAKFSGEIKKSVHHLVPFEAPSEKQLQIRKAWLFSTP